MKFIFPESPSSAVQRHVCNLSFWVTRLSSHGHDLMVIRSWNVNTISQLTLSTTTTHSTDTIHWYLLIILTLESFVRCRFELERQSLERFIRVSSIQLLHTQFKQLKLLWNEYIRTLQLDFNYIRSQVELLYAHRKSLGRVSNLSYFQTTAISV